MQVSLTIRGETERELTVRIPADNIEQEITRRLQDLANKVSIQGFHSGAAPFNVIQSKYDAQIREQVLDEITQSILQQSLAQENLNPVSTPRIDYDEIRPGEGLKFRASFEVRPEIKLATLENVSIEKPVSAVEEHNIDNLLEKLRQQRGIWKKATSTSKKGDRIIINYMGLIDNKPFSGGNGTDKSVVIGSGTMIDGFEDGLTGLNTGESCKMDLKFPDDYFNKEVAGEKVVFDVEVKAIESPELPSLDNSFANSFGVESGMSALREKVASTMKFELDQAIRSTVKARVYDALIEANNIEPPDQLIREEISKLKQQAGESSGNEISTLNLADSLFEDQARKQAILEILLPEVIKKYMITVDNDRVQQTLIKLSEGYEDPEQYISTNQNDITMMKNLEGLVLEDQIVEHLLAEMNVIEVEKRLEDIIDHTKKQA